MGTGFIRPWLFPYSRIIQESKHVDYRLVNAYVSNKGGHVKLYPCEWIQPHYSKFQSSIFMLFFLACYCVLRSLLMRVTYSGSQVSRVRFNDMPPQHGSLQTSTSPDSTTFIMALFTPQSGLPTDPEGYWAWNSRPTHQTCHPGPGNVNLFTSFDISATKGLRAECLYRGLNADGDRQSIEAELFEHNNRWWTSEQEKIADHKRRLRVWQTAKASKITPFRHFNDFPPEIQELVWDFSLPGPRVLCPSFRDNLEAEAYEGQHGDVWRGCRWFRLFSTILPHDEGIPVPEGCLPIKFQNRYHTPAPTALSVCKTSRLVAQRRYRLCFGSPYLYADLEIDILYFGRLDFEMLAWLLRILLPPPVLDDLNCVRMIGIPWDQSSIHTYRLFLRNLLRRNGFRKLDSVLICRGGDDRRLEKCNYPTDEHPDELDMDDTSDREQLFQTTLEVIGRVETSVKVEFEQLVSHRTVPTFQEFKANPYVTST